MSKDDRDLLEVLKSELDFIEQGGYGRSVRTPWKQPPTFQGSLSCINFGDPERTHPCNECHLLDFVPPEAQTQDVPCHHIPLDAAGKTVEMIEQEGDQAEIEEAVKNWLRANIKRLEQERASANQS
jgi:hypothetical protein